MLTLMHAVVCSISSLRLSLFLFAKLDDAHTHTTNTHTHTHITQTLVHYRLEVLPWSNRLPE